MIILYQISVLRQNYICIPCVFAWNIKYGQDVYISRAIPLEPLEFQFPASLMQEPQQNIWNSKLNFIIYWQKGSLN